MEDRTADVAIVGAGIVGLAHAYMLSKRGYRVVLFERDDFAVGASVRNFGLIWPIGQKLCDGVELAMQSRRHWIELADQAGFWLSHNGSLHLAHYEDEWDLLQEFYESSKKSLYDIKLLNAPETRQISDAVKATRLKGSLWSKTECTVNPREAIRKLPIWLGEKYNVQFRFGQQVKEISLPYISSATEKWKVGSVIVCSGADFESLYPKAFTQSDLIKCKLQMMKGRINARKNEIGPTICGGLTLRHYPSFKKCPSLARVDERYDAENMLLKKYGVHVLISQNEQREIIIGDSHEYGKTLEPFNNVEIDQLIIDYMSTLLKFRDITITQHWNGTYAKSQNSLYFKTCVEKDVMVVNGFGGAGMTLSFGVAEQLVNDHF